MVTAQTFRSFSTEDFALTKDDIRFLRRAEEISFYWKDNEAHITAYLPKPKGAEEQPYRNIKVGYHFDGRMEGRVPMSAHHHKLYMRGTSPNPAQTLVAFLREGDVVRLDFYVDNNNDYVDSAYVKTKDAGEGKLHVDTLTVIITRGNKKYAFLIAVGTCLDNSARLVTFRY